MTSAASSSRSRANDVMPSARYRPRAWGLGRPAAAVDDLECGLASACADSS